MSPRIAFGLLFERDPPERRSSIADHQVRAAEVRQAYLARHPSPAIPGASPGLRCTRADTGRARA